MMYQNYCMQDQQILEIPEETKFENKEEIKSQQKDNKSVLMEKSEPERQSNSFESCF